MSSNKLYNILGVKQNASAQEIKKAYRKIARETHPDVKPDDKAAEKRFKEATAAFEVLSNPEKRKLYDQFGEDSLRMGFDAEKARAYQKWQSQPGGAGVGGAFHGFDPGDLGGFGFGGQGSSGGFDLGEILGDLFAQGKRQQARQSPFSGSFHEPAPQKGKDSEANIRVSLLEAVLGQSKEILVDKPRVCGKCNGSGRIGRSVCPSCSGVGHRKTQSTLKVKIPPGISDGQKIRLAGQGQPGISGAAPGDLLIKVHIDKHPFFRREGQDLYLDLPVTLAEAFYGATVNVPTFQGELSVKIPPGSQSGRKLRLKGRGIAKTKGPAGDLYLVISIRLPTDEKEDSEIRKAIDLIESRYSANPRDNIDP